VEHIAYIDASLCHDIFSEPARDLLQNDFDEAREALLVGGLDFRQIDLDPMFIDFEYWLAKVA
jgi:hypothetical protein